MRRLALAIALGLVAGCSGSSDSRSAATSTTQPAIEHPNIVVVLADDLDLASLLDAQRFPVFHALMVNQGTSFTNYFVPDSLCCPSRAALLRGQYVHNTDVRSNVEPEGGFERFHALGRENSTVATWLHDAGYRTALLGKYLNGYPHTVAPDYVPPGWDDWVSPIYGNPYVEYGYTLNVNGARERHLIAPSDYLVDVLTDKARAFLTNNADSRPFFLYLAPFVPHQPATPAPRYENSFPDVRAPRAPSFDQSDMSAEPQWLRSRPRLDRPVLGDIERLYRRRLQSMLAVEDMLRSLVTTLRETHQLERTYIVFTSDNGFHLGEHRLPPGKETAFDEDIHVPLVVRGPGVAAGGTDGRFTSEIDLAPTLAQLAHAPVPDFVDGASFAAELHGARADPAPSGVLIEHFGHADSGAPNDPDDDTHPPIAGAPTTGASAPVAVSFPGVVIPTYRALRTPDDLYVEFETGEKQLYDLRADPYELHNIVATADSSLVQSLADRLARLATCQGSGCRT